MIEKTVQKEYVSSKNLEVVVRDNENLNEFTTRVVFPDEYVKKLVEWVQKRRYSLVEDALENQVTLRVDIFTFSLKLSKPASEEAAARTLLTELR